MACPDCIDVQLLHYHYVLKHVSLTYHIALIGIEFMTVRTLYQNRLAVHKKLAAAHAHIPETEVQRRVLRNIILCIRHRLKSI